MNRGGWGSYGIAGGCFTDVMLHSHAGYPRTSWPLGAL